VTGNKLKDTDLTEKMAFFEAYGALAGEAGIPTLEKRWSKGRAPGGKRSRDPRCAAMARKIRTPKARDVLQKVSQDKEPWYGTRSPGTPRRRGGGGRGGAGHDDAGGKRPSMMETAQTTDVPPSCRARLPHRALYASARSSCTRSRTRRCRGTRRSRGDDQALVDVEKELEIRLQANSSRQLDAPAARPRQLRVVLTS